jgi:hypothetical protein
MQEVMEETSKFNWIAIGTVLEVVSGLVAAFGRELHCSWTMGKHRKLLEIPPVFPFTRSKSPCPHLLLFSFHLHLFLFLFLFYFHLV